VKRPVHKSRELLHLYRPVPCYYSTFVLRIFCLFVAQFKAVLDGEEEGQSHLDSFDEHMD
jgi:hypothetical protein